MIRKSFFFHAEDPTVSLEAYLPENGNNMSAVVILPGGAYFALSDKEGAEVAEYFAGRGVASFLLRYSTMHPSFEEPETPVNPHTLFPEPLYVCAEAIKLIRSNAAEFSVNPAKIAIMGFSAGGHLAANYCNEWSAGDISSAIGAEREEIRPNASILCYAATRLRRSSGAMNMAVFGARETYPAELLQRWCAAENINRDTPPTFLWHCADDHMVPVAQSLEMASALSEEGICYELHVFSEGDHAIGIAEGLAPEGWKDLALDFLERNM